MDDVKVSVNKGVQKIVYNRPKKRNAISKAMYGKIADILKSAALDDNILVTVITGEGDFYSSGADFSDSAANMSSDSETDVLLKQASDIIKNFVAAFIDYPKILIAIVNGPAIGIAATTLGLCDLVFASEKAYFTTPFTKLGLTAEGCSSLTFPQIMGRRKAIEMLYFNYKMTANEALQYGFVNQVIPHSEINKLWPVIYKFASLPRESLLSVKRLVRSNERAALHSANESECKELENRWQSDEFLNGLQKMFRRSSKL